MSLDLKHVSRIQFRSYTQALKRNDYVSIIVCKRGNGKLSRVDCSFLCRLFKCQQLKVEWSVGFSCHVHVEG